MNKILIGLSFFFLIYSFNYSDIKAQITNKIVVKVGSSLVSSVDVKNEIITNLLINGQEITQKNINNNKSYAVKNLIKNLIKKSEIEKYDVKDFDRQQLTKYLQDVAKEFNTNQQGLEKKFSEYDVNYDLFVEKYKTELLWKTLIYRIYSSQMNVNIIDVENEIEKIKNSEIVEYDLSEIEILKTEYNKSKLVDILNIIKNEGFESAVKEFSISSENKTNGRLGWVSSETMSKRYLDQIKNIEIKGITPPIANEKSFSIFKINNIKKRNNKVEIDKLKEEILNKKKEEKLDLFSRSHFSNLENSITISFL